jgi:hypothetical protein
MTRGRAPGREGVGELALKNYKIRRDCRQRGDGLHHAVQAAARMHDLALTA